MRNGIGAVIALYLVLHSSSSNAQAQDYRFVANEVSANPGGQATLTLTFDDLNDPIQNIAGMTFTQEFDAAMLELVDVSWIAEDDPVFSTFEIMNGSWQYSVLLFSHGFAGQFHPGSTDVVEVTYQIAENANLGAELVVGWAQAEDANLVHRSDSFIPELVDGTISLGAEFLRGDANSDGVVGISDLIFIQNYLFLGGAAASCADAMDANNDGTLTLVDVLTLAFHLFLGSAPPPAPFPNCEVAEIGAFGCAATVCP